MYAQRDHPSQTLTRPGGFHPTPPPLEAVHFSSRGSFTRRNSESELLASSHAQVQRIMETYGVSLSHDDASFVGLLVKLYFTQMCVSKCIDGSYSTFVHACVCWVHAGASVCQLAVSEASRAEHC